ncbi:MAG TPA: hypothetical protein VFM29_08975 [Vicinamibacteria bacterium]|nr:hypothetical protein [Vicinamibacteria bacterium]
MHGESLARFVDMWAVGWTLAVLLGYFAHRTPFPRLEFLRSTGVAKVMLLLTAAVVLGLTLAGAKEPSAVLATWAIVISAVKLLYDGLGQTE